MLMGMLISTPFKATIISTACSSPQAVRRAAQFYLHGQGIQLLSKGSVTSLTDVVKRHPAQHRTSSYVSNKHHRATEMLQ